MMEMEKFLEVMGEAGKLERQNYHLSLGGLIAFLENLGAKDTPVVFDVGGSVGVENSYRGYYSDLALERYSAEQKTAGDLLEQCKNCVGATYEGYKGGSYRMSPETILWAAPYGVCGLAITGVKLIDCQVVLQTLDID